MQNHILYYRRYTWYLLLIYKTIILNTICMHNLVNIIFVINARTILDVLAYELCKKFTKSFVVYIHITFFSFYYNSIGKYDASYIYIHQQ